MNTIISEVPLETIARQLGLDYTLMQKAFVSHAAALREETEGEFPPHPSIERCIVGVSKQHEGGFILVHHTLFGNEKIEVYDQDDPQGLPVTLEHENDRYQLYENNHRGCAVDEAEAILTTINSNKPWYRRRPSFFPRKGW
ncbi:MAG: hypothetical protein ABIH34_02230 [Nanoarchaeota archaeon]